MSQVYLNRQPNFRKKLLVPCQLDPPNPKCYVCSEKPQVSVKLNTTHITVKTLEDKVRECVGHGGSMHWAWREHTWGLEGAYMGRGGSIHGVWREYAWGIEGTYMGHRGSMHRAWREHAWREHQY